MTTRAEDRWQCVKCGRRFGRHDMWYEGDLCGDCHQDDEDRYADEHRMVVACKDGDNRPTLVFVKVVTTGANATDEGVEKDAKLARKWAREQGYGAPMVAFNCDTDAAGQAIADKFEWDTADVYRG